MILLDPSPSEPCDMWNAKRTSALIVLICICVLLNSWLGYLRKIQHKPMRNEAHPTYQPSYRSVRPEPNTTQSVSPTRGMNQHKHKTEKEKEEEDKVRVWQRNRLPTILPRGDAGGSVTRGAPKRQRSPPPNLKGRVHSTWVGNLLTLRKVTAAQWGCEGIGDTA